MWNDDRVRLVMGTFFLTGVVLSNAYKNTNVYNMVLPRKSILYQKFQELVDDNFTIYTITEAANFNVVLIENVNGAMWHDSPHHIYQNISTSGGVRHRFQVTSSILRRAGQMRGIKSEEIRLTQALLKNTKLGPYIRSTLLKVLQFGAGLIHRLGKDLEMHDVEEKMIQHLEEEEHKESFDFLRTCHKSAVIAPEFQCLRHVEKLRRLRYSYATLGQDTYFGTNMAFSLAGIVPQNILQRIRATHTSGLFSKWLELLKGTGNQRYQQVIRTPIQAPTMAGNIRVLFHVWAGGLVVSVVIVIFERVIRLWQNNNTSSFS